jgi:hypothetical protein
VNPGVGDSVSTFIPGSAGINIITTPTDLMSLDLGEGTWFVTASCTIFTTNASVITYRLWDKTVIYASPYFIGAQSGRTYTTCCGIVPGPTTIWLSASTPTANVAVNPNNSNLNRDCTMNAFRIA